MMTNVEDETFNYAVGFYWKGDTGPVGCYSMHGEVQFGTLQDAKQFQEYCQDRTKERTYKIFKLVEIGD